MNAKSTVKSWLTLAALLTPLALPAVALAQTAAPTPQAAAPARGGPEGVQAYIDQMHAMLQITPAEQTEWDSFAQVMREGAAGMHQAFEQRGAALPTMTAVQNMQSYADLATRHAKDMEALAAAFQTLYAAMPPAQQQNADAVFRDWYAHPGHH
ncbi:MAG TPA: Spy/CpxP family protein refolding chaperone [Acetobacteraceae bacterium]|jgi:periplasmic protein CpxP/Spy|nr:Spy/CpxP family protein refolding chaperone [Acetobacteraceae bacterium]